MSSSDDYLKTVDEVFGKKVKHVRGYVSRPFGEPLFILSGIEFEDGTRLFIGGEHDCPFIEHDSSMNQKLAELAGEDDE